MEIRVVVMPMMSPGILHSYFLLLLVTFLLICDRTQGTEEDWLKTCERLNFGSPPCKYKGKDDNRTLVPLGYLPATTGTSNNRQGLQISGAATYARDLINNCSCHFKLEIIYKDTKGDEQLSTKEIVDLICEDVAAFIGPEGPTCHTAAMVAGSKNRTMISYKCSDAEVSDKNKFPTFTRLEPPDTQVTNSVLSLLNHYNWKKFTIVCQKGDQFETIAKHLEALAEGQGFTLNDVIIEEYQQLNKNNIFSNILARTKDRTRIYVFLGKTKHLVKFMDQMSLERMFVEGKYMVIYLDHEVLRHQDLGLRLWEKEATVHQDRCPLPENAPPTHKILQKWKSLIVVAGSTYKYDVENSKFAKKVREFNTKDPFNFGSGLNINGLNLPTYTPIYAAHLYDSVMLYAKSLNTMIEEKIATGEPVDVHALARDGTSITQKIIDQGKHGYPSISGNDVVIDENGDSKGSFTAYAIKRSDYSREMLLSNRSFVCSHYLLQVGTFEKSNEYKVNHTNGGPDFVSGFVPKDEPRCGFDGEGCGPKNQGSTIAASILGALLLIACIVYVVWNRRIKVEQEIEGLLWRINLDCLQRGDRQGYGGLHSSKQSLASAMSGDSGFHGRHCQTATYRGAHVRINELKFTKKFTREIMKEMKIMREIRHPNINSFIGAHVDPDSGIIMLLTDFCSKGALMDILENRDIKLDMMFVSSLVNDLVTGMHFLHYNTQLQVHGNLRSSNCLITSRWTLQITDFGLQEFRATANSDDWSNDENAYASSKLLWKAPEHLRNTSAHGTPKGDSYSFGIILYEIFGRAGPYGDTCVEAEEIIEQVRDGSLERNWCRPDLVALKDSDLDYKAEDYILDLMKDCWHENPENRPDFTQIRNRLKKLRQGKKTNIMDQMIERMDKYTNNLEELVTDRTRLLWEEKQKTEDLLHRMLPRSVANALCEGKPVAPKSFSNVTIYFSDIVGFTKLCSESTPFEVVEFLNALYTIFDRAIQDYDVYKVETIGDAYMVVSGLPVETPIHAAEICTLSLQLLSEVKSFQIPHRPNDSLKLRIGIHSGGVVAGVVGLAMPRYCLFGDTVNTASRMESNGEPLKIHISKECNQELMRVGGFITEERGLVPMKGKGDVLTYWLKASTNDNPVQRKGLDEANLKPLFKLPKNLASNAGANSQEIVRRRSPRMSMASGDVRQSFRERERNTPDSARNSSLQLSTNRQNSAGANAAANSQTRNGTPPVEKDGDMFRLQPLQLNNKFLNIRAGNSSPRGGRKHPTIKSTNWSSSHTLNIPNSPLASRKHHSDQNNSANNSPVLKQKLRTRSFSDDRSSETLPLFNMIPSPENDEETYQLLTSENQNEKAEKPGKLESAVL